MERNEEPMTTRDLASFRDTEARNALSHADSQPAASSPALAPPQALDDTNQGAQTLTDTDPEDGVLSQESRADQLTPPNGARRERRPGSGENGQDGPLLRTDSTAGFQSRWEGIQTQFVDDPRRAVEHADSLVAAVMQELAESFAQERERLEAQWGRGEDISTEDLRIALQRYRSFFKRLLST